MNLPTSPCSSEEHTSQTIQLQTIGVVHTCFPEKFGIPRQPNLAPAAQGVVELFEPYNQPAAVKGLENTSHLWIEFLFHQNNDVAWRPSIRPPRLGGNRKMGVFATRSPVRPNALGLSVVALERVEIGKNGVFLHISGVDMVSGTPVLDIKPYVPYVDSVPQAVNGFAESAPSMMPVLWYEEILTQLEDNPAFKKLIEQVLQQDPRPQYHALEAGREYGMLLDQYNVTWCYERAEEKTEGAMGWQIRVQKVSPVREK